MTRTRIDREILLRSKFRISVCGILIESVGLGILAVCLLFGELKNPILAGEAQLKFETDIRPILRAYCLDCHGATQDLKGNLDLRLVRKMIEGGDSGPALVPGQPAASRLLERTRLGEMPPGEKKLSKHQMDVLERWIATGAKTARPEPQQIGPGIGITEEERNYWFFQPIRPPSLASLTEVGNTNAKSGAPADRLDLLVELPTASMADRRTLIKRAYLELIGLPPSPEEMRFWLSLEENDWFDRMLNELLSSPHYGEHWGRHWLDVAGYADSDGFTANDTVRPWVWKYRDWVVRALNSDMPFDQFVTSQLAGDELAGPINGDLTSSQIELLTATGFLRLAADGTGSGADTPEARNQVMTDTLKIVGSSLFGLTIHCAQCHDHRYDPIHQTDYFALRAVFEPALDWKSWKTPDARRVSLYTASDRQKAAEIEQEAQKISEERRQKQDQYMAQALEKELSKFEEPLRTHLREAYQAPRDRRSAEQQQILAKYPSVNITPGVLYQYLPDAAEELKKFDARINETRSKKPPEEFLHALIEPANSSAETQLFFRGDYQQPRQVITPRALSVISPESPYEFPLNDPALPTTGRRLSFAHWLTNPENPLFSRVITNRVWMHHFGRGLVSTPGDFGKLGAMPTNPALLDWLASEFIRQGWSLKALHRKIMTSAYWKQTKEPAANEATGAGGIVDRLASAHLIRLEAEAIRDRMLAATGTLDRRLFGAPVAIKEDETGQIVVDGQQTRRSMYIQVRRSRPVAMLQAFDAPVMETNCESRASSTAATQSLMLLNGEFILEQAAKLADRAAAECEPISGELIHAAPKITNAISTHWQYGYGAFHEACGTTVGFTPLTHWTGSQWQASANLPDQQLGWVLLNANGGHPDVSERSAIRRWTAPVDASVVIRGSLLHGSANGDGIRGRIVSSRSGKLGEWTVHNGKVETVLTQFNVRAGETIDFITDCLGDFTSDSFEWPASMSCSSTGRPDWKFSSAESFSGPGEPVDKIPGQIVRAWELALCRPPSHDELVLAVDFVNRQLATHQPNPQSVPSGKSALRQAMTNVCHCLLGSNEFLYVE